MSGFPTRPLRPAFGPEPKNRFPVRDPERELDGETVGKLMMHQITGSGLTVPRAWFVLNGLAVTPVLLSRAEAWNPKGVTDVDFPAPVVARTAQGIFTVTYAATFKDETGVAMTLDLIAAVAHPYEDGTDFQRAYRSAANVITVKHRDSGGSLVDARKSFVLVW